MATVATEKVMGAIGLVTVTGSIFKGPFLSRERRLYSGEENSSISWVYQGPLCAVEEDQALRAVDSPSLRLILKLHCESLH